MKYYIDLGAYDGNLLEQVIKKYPDFDYYIAFELIPILYKEMKKRFRNNKKVKIYRKVVSTRNKKKVKFYICYCTEKGGCKGKGKEIGTGSTLLNRKKTGNIKKSRYIYVETINFSEYVKENFSKDNFIVLKIDIEGEEYPLLEYMIQTGAIFYINKIYCEWHFHKLDKRGKKNNPNQERHNKLIKKLNKIGFELTGVNTKDELDYLLKTERI